MHKSEHLLKSRPRTILFVGRSLHAFSSGSLIRNMQSDEEARAEEVREEGQPSVAWSQTSIFERDGCARASVLPPKTHRQPGVPIPWDGIRSQVTSDPTSAL